MDDAKGGFVSRGGVKLQAAISSFKLQISNLVCLDVGSSTGGFVDCLLQNGASKVYSVDTCYGELAWKLRQDPRVVVLERTNILHLETLPCHSGGERSEPIESSTVGPIATLQGDSKVDLITIDAGWTRLGLALPVVKKFLKSDGQIIALLKPHYEAEKFQLKKGILQPEYLDEVVESAKHKIENLNFKIENCLESPIKGGAGNTEFLLLIKLQQV